MANRAVVAVDLKGDPQEAWKLVTKEKPHAAPGYVVIRMTLRAINPADTFSPKVYLGPHQGKGVVIGSEGVGYVEEVGEGVTKVKVGQRVVPSFLEQFSWQGNGSWQDYVAMAERDLYILPDSIPDEVAAQFIVNPWTVYGILKVLDVPKGEYLLQTAASSMLGRQTIQLAKHWGIKTINVVRRDDIKEELKSLGADEVINSNNEDLVARVKEITGGKGAYSAMDAVAGILTKAVAASVRDGGLVLLYGALSGFDATVGLLDFGRVQIKWWILPDYLDSPERTQEVADAVTKLLEDKVMTPLTGKTYKMEDFKEALIEAYRPSRGGKVLLAN